MILLSTVGCDCGGKSFVDEPGGLFPKNGDNFLYLKFFFEVPFSASITILFASKIFSKNLIFFSSIIVYSSFSGTLTLYLAGWIHLTPALIQVVHEGNL